MNAMELMLWNLFLTGAVGVIGFMIKGKFDEVDRIQILLNKTREEIARDNITRAEVHRDMEKIMERLDAGIERLENKIEMLAGIRRNG